jgi:aminopeptidase YwaD
VDLSVARTLLESAGLDLAALKARIDSTRAPASRELPAKVSLEVRARYHAKQPSVNVVGVVEGSDPALRHQYVVVGAHLDHVGSQAGEIYFPGANDNASGSATVVALARAFGTSTPAPGRPRRSVILALWSSEEAGLLGAGRFMARPPVPAESIAAYVNVDCVGHGDSIEVGGGKTYPRLWGKVRDLDRGAARLTVEETWNGGGADALPFESHKIPNLYFASKFSYTHLHLPTDLPETLNPPLLEAVARLAFRTAWVLADTPARPADW